MDDSNGKEEEEYKPKSPNKTLTGKIKLLDPTGVGYIICDQNSDEYLITPSSFSNFQTWSTIKQGYFVKFTPKFRSSIPQLKAFDIVLIGQFKCFNCNKFGHLAYNCTLSKVKCHRCGLHGHYFWDCNVGSINQVEGQYTRGLNSKKEQTLRVELTDAEIKKGSGGVVCVKSREDVKKVEEVEDCFILDFDPTKTSKGVKLEKEGGGFEKLSSIVSVKKRGDVEKVEQVEDCFILEFDLDEPVKFNNLSLSVCSSDNLTVFEDDLSIVAEKGQVACRDFPHPRHLCAKYPFNRTSHRIYCEKCYCYICDIPAPCSKWTWIEGPMHCHASGEEWMWKNIKQMQKRA